MGKGEITFYGNRILYKDYLKTEEFQKLKKELLEACDYECEECGKTNTKLIAHHIKYPEDFIDDNIENLELLCEDCHETTHNLNEILCPFCKEGIPKNEMPNHLVMIHHISDGELIYKIVRDMGGRGGEE